MSGIEREIEEEGGYAAHGEVDRGPGSSHPRVWLLLGEKPGDNAQILNLARAVGWEFETKTIRMLPRWLDGKPWVRPRLDHVDMAGSDALEPPWPDLVITAGRRLSCVGFWIKRASSGGTRLVMVGQPRRLHSSVDLIVAAAHYRVRDAKNVVRHDLPFMNADPERLASAVRTWQPRLAGMARPLTALMVGGPTGGLRFDLAVARALFEKTLASVREDQGSLYITTSRRTPRDVVEMLRRERPESTRLFEFGSDATTGGNPYHALLGLADRFVVTSDSASMLVEVARLGRPLAIHPLESTLGPVERRITELGWMRPLSPTSDPIPAGGFRARMMYRLGRPIHSRDLSAIPRLLVDGKRACWLGQEWVVPPPFVDHDLDRVAGRVRALLSPESEKAG